MSQKADFPSSFNIDRGYAFDFGIVLYSDTSPTKVPYVFEVGDSARCVIKVPGGTDQVANGSGFTSGQINFSFTGVQTALLLNDSHDYFLETTLSGTPLIDSRGRIEVR